MAGRLARPLAELRRVDPVRGPARARPARRRPGRRAPRPREQLRSAARSPPRSPSAGSSPVTCAAAATSCSITTKAGYRAWPGPYGEHGSREVPAGLARRVAARASGSTTSTCSTATGSTRRRRSRRRSARSTAAVRSGKARHAGISSYSADRTVEALDGRARRSGCASPCTSPPYSLLNRWVEQPGDDGRSLLDVAGDAGMAVVAFSPLAQGMLSTRYLHGVPADSRAARGGPLRTEWLTDEALDHVRALDAIARAGGRTLPAAGARVGAARPARHVGARGRPHHGAAGREPRRRRARRR